jgi:type IV pilus assembly protein PilW
MFPRAAVHRGLSLVELLVGVAVGLFIVGGATKLLVDNLNSNRRNLLETRVNQDLRAAADLIARDLRRSGYWRNAASGVWGTVGGVPVVNNYAEITATNSGVLDSIQYGYAKDANDALDTNERFGYSVSSGVLQYQAASGVTQPITDPGTVSINFFDISETVREVELYMYCSCITTLKCSASQFAASGATYSSTRPRTQVREYLITLKGTSATDSRVSREIREAVRVRNDKFVGGCPTIL